MMRSLALRNDLVIDIKREWTSVDRVILVTTNCYPDRIEYLENMLRALGLRKLDVPVLMKPKRGIVETLCTTMCLWSRSGKGL
jgi:hypothetical protein